MTLRFKKPCILIVDDSIVIRDLLEAVNGREAVEMARSCIPEPDLILLDIHMPVMDTKQRPFRKVTKLFNTPRYLSLRVRNMVIFSRFF